MQKSFSLCLFLLVLGVAGTAMLLPVDAEAMDFDGRCFCGMTSTGSFTGVSDNDCPWAKMNAFQQADVCGTDGTCEFTVLFDEGGCSPDGPTRFEYDITVRQSCNICF